jgi:hypothetical protein
MADQSEQIEAKLAAYIDGELTGGDREEIEKHLAANPSHLALVTDLMWHKQLVKGLPRELAPVSMNEDLQSQLERDVLLSGGDPAEEARAVAGRIHRWPQIFSAAAILAMTAGLAAVVYSVLPGKRPTGVALENQTAPVVQPEGGAAPRPDTPAIAGEGRAMKGADQPEAPLVARAETNAGAAGGTTFAAGRGSAGNTPSPEVEEALVTVGEPEILVLAVSADDLDVARGQVMRYLAANQLAYRAAGGGGSSLVRLANGNDTFNETAGDVLARSTVLYQRQVEGGVSGAAAPPRLTEAREGELALDPDLRKAARSMEEKSDGNAVAESLPRSKDPAQAGQALQEQAQQAPAAPDVIAQADRSSRSIRPSPVRGAAPPAELGRPAPAPAAQAPSPVDSGGAESAKSSGSEPGKAGSPRDSLVAEVHRFADEQSIKLGTTAAAGEAAGRVIVVRNINGRQVQELASRLRQAQDSVAAKQAQNHWHVALFTPDQQRKLLGEQQAVALAEQVVRTADTLEPQELAAGSRGEAEGRDRRRAADTPESTLRSDAAGVLVDSPPLDAAATRPAQPRADAAPADFALSRDKRDPPTPSCRWPRSRG